MRRAVLRPSPGALPDTLGGEERLENMGLDFRRDARSVVAGFDQQAIQLAGGADAQFALALDGVDGVVDRVGPDLIQLAAARADLRQGAVEIELHAAALLYAVPQHQQGAFETQAARLASRPDSDRGCGYPHSSIGR